MYHVQQVRGKDADRLHEIFLALITKLDAIDKTVHTHIGTDTSDRHFGLVEERAGYANSSIGSGFTPLLYIPCYRLITRERLRTLVGHKLFALSNDTRNTNLDICMPL